MTTVRGLALGREGKEVTPVLGSCRRGYCRQASGPVQILQEKNTGLTTIHYFGLALSVVFVLFSVVLILIPPGTHRGEKSELENQHTFITTATYSPPREKSSLHLSSSQPRTAHARDKSSVHLPWPHYKNHFHFLSATFHPSSAHERIFEESSEETRASIDVAGSTGECPHRTLPIQSSR